MKQQPVTGASDIISISISTSTFITESIYRFKNKYTTQPALTLTYIWKIYTARLKAKKATAVT